MSFEVEPPQKKKKTNPSPPSFLSLPDVTVVNCLARISRSYYPKLSLVCKTFRSYVSSNELYVARLHNKTIESFVHVCLQLPDHHRPSWFTLWMKPDQTLTNGLTRRKNRSLRNTLLVPTPSSYYWCLPSIAVTLGSEYYALKQCHSPSTDMLVGNKDEIWQWRKIPNMNVARENAIACTLDSKIYVMGGCAAEESTNWAEVFDTNTQTWEPLPDPGAELRFSSIISVQEVTGGKLQVRSNQKKDYTYDPKEDKWDVVGETRACCVVEDICYSCDRQSCLWYDAKHKEWRRVRGLAKLNKKPRRGMIELATYRGKLLILWDKFAHGGPGGGCRYKNIWCAVIALEKRNGDEVRGKVEWANVVLIVPDSYVFLRSTVLRA